jgi:hypothetical protein
MRFDILIRRNYLMFYDGKKHKTSDAFKIVYDFFYDGDNVKQLFDSGFETDYPQAKLEYSELKLIVGNLCSQHKIRFNEDTKKGQRELNAIESLIRAHTGPISRDGSLGFMYPCGGHIVKMAYWWEWGKFGIKSLDSLGVIDGCVQRGQTDVVQITFNAYAGRYRNNSGLVYVSSSGGPGTALTPVSELERSNETIEMRYWIKERVGLGQFQEVPYTMVAPVWYWYPSNE